MVAEPFESVDERRHNSRNDILDLTGRRFECLAEILDHLLHIRHAVIC